MLRGMVAGALQDDCRGDEQGYRDGALRGEEHAKAWRLGGKGARAERERHAEMAKPTDSWSLSDRCR